MRNLTIIFLLVVLTSCHSKKNIASSGSANANTITTTDMRVSTSKLDSAFSSMAIELDSFDITAEPVLIAPCPDSVANRSAVIAYRYRIKANSATVKGEKNAVSRACADTLHHDSLASNLVHSSASSEHRDTVSVYKPPDATIVIIIAIVIAIIIFVILWKFRK